MNAMELRRAIDEGEEFRFEAMDIEDVDGFLCINSLIPMPIMCVSSEYEIDRSIDVVDESGINIGVLCVFDVNRDYVLSDITDHQYSAYLADARPRTLYKPYRFTKSYFVVEKDFFSIYCKKYLTGSTVWGGFLHEKIPAPYICHRESVATIQAVPQIEFPTPQHEAISCLALYQSTANERFLRRYHLIELLFDLSVVKKIKSLPLDDLRGFGKIMSSYSFKEIERIRDIFSDKISDFGLITPLMRIPDRHEKIAHEIFVEFAKADPPYSGNQYIQLSKSDFSFSTVSEVIGNIKNVAAYNKFLVKVLAYYIYRIRCSIVHSRIGEFIFSPSDENFIVEFAEPLIRAILFQVLRGNTTL